MRSSRGSSLVLHFSYYTLMTFLKMSVILLSMLMILLLSTLYSERDQTSYLWQQLELASKLESHLWDTVDSGRRWFVYFNAGKNQLVSFDRTNSSVAIDVKIDNSALEENHFSRCWECLSPLNSTGDFLLSIMLNLLPRKLKLWFVLWSFLLLRLLFISINWPYSLASTTVAMSRLVLPAATWIC